MKRFRVPVLIFVFMPLLGFAAKDPADYPLKVHILQQEWSSHNVYRSEYRATGRGNIWEGDTIHGFDFSYDCSFGLRRTARNQPYLAKWKKPQFRLALLAAQIGKDGKYQECDVQTTVHDGVYILRAGTITEMSQQDFNAMRARMASGPQNPASTAPQSALSKLSVSSTPDSAEIEIDGEFVGNTPSLLQLDPGEHTVIVRKAGYKLWQKKLKLVAGEVKLNAELEAEGAK